MNEAPADLKSNLQRAWANFSEDRVSGCSKPKEFKACLYCACQLKEEEVDYLMQCYANREGNIEYPQFVAMFVAPH